MTKPVSIWYEQPARQWGEALPIGNGSLGGMVFSGAVQDHIQLNLDTLWSGRPRQTVSQAAREALPQARELVRQGKHAQAKAFIEQHMLGVYSNAYEPMGDLYLDFEDRGVDYRRSLSLNDGLARLHLGAQHRRYFCSYPDQALVIHLTDVVPMDFTLRLTSPLEHTYTVQGDRLLIDGRCPTYSQPNYVQVPDEEAIEYADEESIHFALRVGVKTDGAVSATQRYLSVSGATQAVIVVTAASSFAGYDKMPFSQGKDPVAPAEAALERALGQDIQTLLDRHIADHRALFDRVELDLGAPKDQLPTDARLAAMRQGEDDLDLVATLFQYGRYLMIACSRPGTQPANLQGIWNQELRPPWSSNYTSNINIQMNYWPAEVCALSECQEPIFAMLKELAVSGAQTARVNYGCGGWTLHHNTDLWRLTTPVSGEANYAFWPMGGAWLCRQITERYQYTQDQAFLAEYYPVMRGAAEFLMDWMVLGDDGRWTTSPSTSPENSFLDEEGNKCSVASGSAMDLSIIRDTLENLIAFDRILGGKDDVAARAREVLPKLKPLTVGPDGRLLEWDRPYPEWEEGHRHVSHLYGLYPASLMLPGRDDALRDAAKASLDYRLAHGGGHTGWSCAWIINLFARLLDGEQAWKYVRTLVTRSTYDNLFDAHPPFQIDGNFGFASGVAEMLLQSHAGALQLLPALPEAWQNGSVKGLRARGDIGVDIRWEDGVLAEAWLRPEHDGPICLQGDYRVTDQDGKLAPMNMQGAVLARAGEVYRVTL